MTWILLAVAAQFINALVALMDKFIVASKAVASPFMYAFYVCALSALSIIAFAFGELPIPRIGLILPTIDSLALPSIELILGSLVAGVTIFLALFYMFDAFRTNDASDVKPVVGATAAVSVLAASGVVTESLLGPWALVGVALIVLGTLLTSRFRFSREARIAALISGVCFGFHAVSLKFIFEITDFSNGFFWSRTAIALVALSAYAIVVLPGRKKRKTPKLGIKKHAKSIVWVIGNKALAGVASILLLRAIQLGDVAAVQALDGLQFAFILVLGLIFGNRTSDAYGERYERKDMIQKVISTVLICAGFAMLFM